MYSSSSGYHPFQYMTNQMQTATTSSFLDTHQKPSSIQEEPYYCSSSLLNFTAPFLDDGDLLLSELLTHQNQHLHQEQKVLGCNEIGLAAETDNQEMNNHPAASKAATKRINNKKRTSKNTNGSKQPIPRKRSGRKERHSKIHTAQGPRDRRMRLSLQIARKFFDLQDMLGFDKASKTIDWLFTKSKAAIKELTDSLPKVKRSSNSGDGSRSISTLETDVTTDNNGDKRGMEEKNDSFVCFIEQTKCEKSNEKPAVNLLARESRDKARARARARTKEKLKLLDKFKDCSSQPSPDNLEKLGPSSLLENGEKQALKSDARMNIGGQEEEEEEEDQATAQEPSTNYFQLPHQMDSISIVDKFLGLASASKSSSIFDLSQSIVFPSGPQFEDQEFSGFPGNWDIISNGRALNMKLSATGYAHVQNPNAVFATPSSNAQEQNFTSDFMAPLDTHEENPNSVFANFSNSNVQNPNYVPMTIIDAGFLSHFTEDQFPRNRYAANNRTFMQG